MKPLSLQDIRGATGGRALFPMPQNPPRVKAVCTDTRAMLPESLFIPIRGEKFDAHAFVGQAAAAGAIAALVESPPAEPPPGMFLFQVDDTRKAMGRVAKLVRQGFSTTKVIAVAGSNGKTTTKNLIHAACNGRLRGSTSPKSFNNDIGVPVTIFAADPAHDYVVLEMGTNHHGEIRPLSEMALPDIAVLTNCSAEHLEGLTDLAGVRRENVMVTAGMNQAKGTLVVNGDDPALLAAVDVQWKGRKLTFGLDRKNDLFATDVECTDTHTRFRLNGSRREVLVPILGRHNAVNALAAIAVGKLMKLADDEIIANLLNLKPPEMRMQLSEIGGLKLINDAYNANPASMRAGLETLATLVHTGRRIAVVGEMRELGATHEPYHREIGQYLATLPLDRVACVANGGKIIADAAVAAGFAADRIEHFTDASAAAASVPGWLQPGDLVLLKASRGIHLEQVAQAIRDRLAPG
jgi:UDP-N-acetylmuramoyl-tripeptide--D-alanyl-D-alanine ligase